MPRGCQGVAAGGLRAGRATLQSLPGGHGDVQHHVGHAVVSVAGGLSVISLLQLTRNQWGEI